MLEVHQLISRWDFRMRVDEKCAAKDKRRGRRDAEGAEADDVECVLSFQTS